MRVLKYRPKRLALIAQRNREEIVRAKLSRRDLIKLGLLSGAGYLVAKKGLSVVASGDPPTSPPTTPFAEALPIPVIKSPVASLNPSPQVNPLPGEGRTRPHQALAQFPPIKLYEVHQREAPHSFHPQLPTQPIWGFDGTFPGPTYVANYGEPILVRNFNDLPQDHQGFGIPQVSTHLHNGHTPSESDGFPCDFFPFQVGGTELFYDQHYPNVLAGFTDPRYAPLGDPLEALSTLWYHDHRVDFTAQNVYKGLAGFFLLFNNQDTGNETTGFRLPSGPYDIPMIFADKLFDQAGQLFFDLFGFDGLVGDKFTVNGKIQPYLRVAPRRYRFRWLDGGPSRFYQFFLTNPNNLSQSIPFTQISNDGNLLPQSRTVNSVRLSVAERADVIVDFTQAPPGTRIYLENRLEQKNGRAPTDKILPAGQGDFVLRFDVDLPSVADFSLPPPYAFYALPTRDPEVATRTWRFERQNGQWAINQLFMDCDTPRAFPTAGRPERWILQNNSGGWQHPIHIHFEEFRILTRNGKQPPVTEIARKDVARLGFNEEIQLYIRFRDFSGRYPMHCHNTIHEDHAMMLRFDVVQ